MPRSATRPITAMAAALSTVAAALAFACDARVYGDVERPVLETVAPASIRAGRFLTITGQNLDLTPWDAADVPPSAEDPDPIVPLPYALEVRVGDALASVVSVAVGGVVVRVPDDLAPGWWPVQAFVERRASNTIALEIVEEPLLELAIVPDPLVVAAGDRRTFALYGLDGTGAVELIAGPGVPPPPLLESSLTFDSSNGRVARVDVASMEIVGTTAGEVVLRARLGVLEARAAVVVVESAR